MIASKLITHLDMSLREHKWAENTKVHKSLTSLPLVIDVHRYQNQMQ